MTELNQWLSARFRKIWQAKPKFKPLETRFKISSPTGALVALILGVTIININQTTALAKEKEFLQSTPEQVDKIATAIATFTPTIQEDLTDITYVFATDQVGLLKKPEVTETIVSPRSYTVAKGDNLSTIAEKFGLTVATVLEANDLKGGDTTNIQVGQQLVIPPENTSTSLAWLEEEQKVREERERKSRLQAQQKIAAANARRVAIRASSREVAEGGFDGESSGKLILPVKPKHKGRCGLSYHPGQDLPADEGTPVVAADGGKVVEETGGWSGGWGNSLIIDHGNGVRSRYAHLSRKLADLGDQVAQDQVIGTVGHTGRSFGPHLHFDKIVNGRNVRICF